MTHNGNVAHHPAPPTLRDSRAIRYDQQRKYSIRSTPRATLPHIAIEARLGCISLGVSDVRCEF